MIILYIISEETEAILKGMEVSTVDKNQEKFLVNIRYALSTIKRELTGSKCGIHMARPVEAQPICQYFWRLLNSLVEIFLSVWSRSQ
jgi:hypothetical protein